MFEFLSAWRYSMATEAARSTAQDARATAGIAREEITVLRGQVDRLQMICEAMWTLVKQRTGVEDAELSEMVKEIDLRDGKRDGRSHHAGQMCSRCGRVVSVRTQVCIYCGEHHTSAGVF